MQYVKTLWAILKWYCAAQCGISTGFPNKIGIILELIKRYMMSLLGISIVLKMQLGNLGY